MSYYSCFFGLTRFFSFIVLLSFTAPVNAALIPIVKGMNASMGEGYLPKEDAFKGLCVTGTTGQIPSNIDSSFDFTATVSKEQMAEELGIDLKGSAQFGVTKASMAAKFLKTSMSDAYSISAMYTGTYSFHDEGFTTEPTLTPRALQLTSPISIGRGIDNPKIWENTCGQEFVNRREFGAKLFFSIRIDFKSEEEKQALAASFSLSAPLVTAEASVNTASSKTSKETRITVSALQIGGDVSQITRIFGNGTTTPGNDGATAVVSCSMGDFNECRTVLGNAVRYATNIDTGFPSQLTTRANQALLRVHTKPYEQMFVYNMHTAETMLAYENARNKLIQLFHKNYDLSIRTSRLANPNERILRLSPRQERIITDTDLAISRNIAKLTQANAECFQTPSKCISHLAILQGERIVKPFNYFNPMRLMRWARSSGAQQESDASEQPTGEKQLEEIDESVLMIRPETFAQYCDFWKSIVANATQKETIKSLIAKAKSIESEPFATNTDQCAVAENILSHRTGLNLTAEQLKDPDSAEVEATFTTSISDLKILSVLTQLETLNLSGNAIADISPLQHLTNLRKLNLSNNEIADVNALIHLPNLVELDLSGNGNRLRDVAGLALHPALTRLNLANNWAGIQCPFADPTRCTLVVPGAGTSFAALETGLHQGRAHHVAFPLHGDRVLVMGGSRYKPICECSNGNYTITGNLTAVTNSYCLQSEIYDYGNDTCTPLPGLDVGTHHSAGVVLNDGRVLLTGGFGTAIEQSPYCKDTLSVAMFTEKGMQNAITYNPATQAVDHLQLIVPRAMHTATKLNDGNVLIVGGSKIILHPRPAIPSMLSMLSMFCGKAPISVKYGLASAEIFDPNTNAFTPVAETLRRPRAGHTATLLSDGNVLLTGGRAENEILRDAILYDSLSGRFQALRAQMSASRYAHQATLLTKGSLAGKVLITGGYSQIGPDIYEGIRDAHNPLQEAELYDPVSKAFEPIHAQMISARAEHTATLLEDGNVLLAAGIGAPAEIGKNSEAQRSAELFDLATNSFISIPMDMNQCRAGHTATPLSSTRVLMIGGHHECKFWDTSIMTKDGRAIYPPQDVNIGELIGSKCELFDYR